MSESSLFAARIRERISSLPHVVAEEAKNRGDDFSLPASSPHHLNVMLLGPSGAGKSSLIYTWWRALSGPTKNAKGKQVGSNVFEFEHHSTLKQLQIGWSMKDIQTQQHPSSQDASNRELAKECYEGVGFDTNASQLTAAPQHGTESLRFFELQACTSRNMGIKVHDTKGQTFFNDSEMEQVDLLLGGKLEEGSNEERRTFRYWLRLGNIGFFSSCSLSTTPHVVILVLDASLRLFSRVLKLGKAPPAFLKDLEKSKANHVRATSASLFDGQGHQNKGENDSHTGVSGSREIVDDLDDIDIEDDDDGEAEDTDATELVNCYANVIKSATMRGQEVFVVLTHMDKLLFGNDKTLSGGGHTTSNSTEHSNSENDGDALKRQEASIENIKIYLCEALLKPLELVGSRLLLPPERVFAVENYRKLKFSTTPQLELESLAVLETATSSAWRFCKAEAMKTTSGCTLS